MQVFIKGFKVNDDEMLVEYKHLKPFDKKFGLSEVELQSGYIIEDSDIPEQQYVEGRIAKLMYSIKEGKCYWDYSTEAPPPPVTLNEVNEKLDIVMQMLLESEGLI